MGRSDDSISRRRNRKSRRKEENKKDSSSKVSSRVASIIASKKRRLSGKRSMCQGMCFSLPSPEDPYNDRQGKPEATIDKKRKQKTFSPKVTESKHAENKISEFVSCIACMGPEIAINLGKPMTRILKLDGSNHSWDSFENTAENRTECPSRFLTMCLNSTQTVLQNGVGISNGGAQTALQNGGGISNGGDKPLFAYEWGLEFWNCYCSGKDVLEIGGANSTHEQIAWIASTAAETISAKEKEGISLSSPFLLYLVPSQDKASEVRQLCKSLKAHGVHTVSIHSGASIDHQINGLKSCDPEFIVSTPERLLELLSLKAVDVSRVSLVVIEGLQAPSKGFHFDSVKSITHSIPKTARTVVFCHSMNDSSLSAL